MNGRIKLKGMVFYAYHGAHAEENALGQRFIVDVALSLDLAAAAAGDDLHATVNYARVHELCRQVLETDRVKLLETLCARVTDRIFAEYPRVERVEVVIKKPAAPINGVLDYVAVESNCTRADRRLPRPGQ